MADRSRSRRSAQGASKLENDNGDNTPEQAKDSVEINRAKVSKRLEELTLPVLEKYGQPAFDELHSWLERVVNEFTDEVQTLFDDLVGQAKSDHDRLIGLLRRDANEPTEETADAVPVEEEVPMSDYERKLESQDSVKGSDSDAPGDGDSNGPADDEG